MPEAAEVRHVEQKSFEKPHLGKRRAFVASFPKIVERVSGFTHRVIDWMPEAVDKKTLHKATSIEALAVQKVATGVLTRETKVPGTEIDRGVALRFEREEIARAYGILRDRVRSARTEGEKIQAETTLKSFRKKARTEEKNLDQLYRQFYENKVSVNLDQPELGVDEISVAVLDINPPKEGQPDTRTPYVLFGTWVSSPVQIAEFAMQLARRKKGEKVLVVTYPEKYLLSKPGKNWAKILKANGTLDPYVRVFGRTIEKLREGGQISTDLINVVAISMGAEIALEMASSPDFASQINDLIAVEPPGLTEKNQVKFLADYGLRESPRALVNAEERIKVAVGEYAPENTATLKEASVYTIPILAKRLITWDKLRRIMPKGRYQVWVSGHSSITGEGTRKALIEAELERSKDPQASPLELYVIEGGRHQTPIVHAAGVTEIMTGTEKPVKTITKISQKDLDNSAAAAILRTA